ncbi:hypothetical protein [Flavobacterium chryseum]|uniref:hypothetical protein n=1 Tax=Flavobacterium sp. P3160 TaxID=2512113 RepID=UPI00105EC674|nr:hypothetical protein [Flavobacterium sp. P3160]
MESKALNQILKNKLTDIHLKSKKKTGYWKGHILGILFFLFISIFSLTKYNPENYSTNICLILSIIFLIGTLICTYNLISIKNYCIVNNKLLQVSSFGKTTKSYTINDVESWTEKQYKGKFDKWEMLTLHLTTGKKIKICSDYYANYYEIKNEITKDKKRNLKIEELIEKKINFEVSIIFIIIGILFFIGANNALKVKMINSKDLIVFGDEILNIKYIRKKHNSISIKLKNSPDLDFYISGNALKATFVKDLLNDIKQGDTLFIGIAKGDYLSKIVKTDSLSFSDKYFFNENISVESVRSATTDYLYLSENNASRFEDRYWNFGIFGVSGLFFILLGINGVRLNCKE